MLRIPYRHRVPAIILFCCIGAYAVNNSPVDAVILVAAGAFGYLLSRLDCDPTPLLLSFILGPMLEENFRRSMIISHGDPAIFLVHPLSASLLAVAVLILIASALPAIRRKRDEVFVE